MKPYHWLLAGVLGLGLLSGCGGDESRVTSVECSAMYTPGLTGKCEFEGCICVETTGCSCTVSCCHNGVKSGGTINDVSCEALDLQPGQACLCKTYTLDGDWDEECNV